MAVVIMQLRVDTQMVVKSHSLVLQMSLSATILGFHE